MSDRFQDLEFVRISCDTSRASRPVACGDINEYLAEIFCEVFHKLECSEGDAYGDDFIVARTEDLDTMQGFVSHIVSSKFPSVMMSVSRYQF